MAFKDLGDWSKLGGLELPIKGKMYAVPPVDAELGPQIQALVSAGVNVMTGGQVDADDRELLSDLAERELYQRVLGPAYDEMVADKVPWPALKHAAMTVMIDTAIDRKTAEMFWQRLGKPPARRPTDRKPKATPAKKAAAKKTAARKATASRTRRASTAGTTTSRNTPAKAAKRTPTGRRSSGTGG